MPLVSVIIPTFNSQEYLESCIESIISQKNCEIEICIIDGGSLDNTIKIAKNYESRFRFIRFMTEKDNGPYDAMNKGIDIATGDWLYFIGSSDLLYQQNVLQEVFANPIPASISMLYGNVLVSGDTDWAKNGQIYDGEFNKEKIMQKNICHQAIFYRRSAFKRIGKYNLKYPICADWDMNMRFFSKTKAQFIDLIVARFTGGGLSTKMEVKEPILEELQYLKKKYFGLLSPIVNSLEKLKLFR